MNNNFIENNNKYDTYNNDSKIKYDKCNLLYIDLILCLKKYKIFQIINYDDEDEDNLNIEIKNKNKCNYLLKMYNECLI